MGFIKPQINCGIIPTASTSSQIVTFAYTYIISITFEFYKVNRKTIKKGGYYPPLHAARMARSYGRREPHERHLFNLANYLISFFTSLNVFASALFSSCALTAYLSSSSFPLYGKSVFKNPNISSAKVLSALAIFVHT